MTSYLILPTEQEALDRSHRAHVGDTARKMEITEEEASTRMTPEEFVTQYRWATDVGNDGQTALVIDGDEQLLTQTEMTKLVRKLPDAEGENWYKPPPEMPGSGAPVNVDAPYVSQSGNLLSCTMGNWTGEPTSYAYQWQTDGTDNEITAPTYTVTAAYAGHTMTCRVTATNAAGSTPVMSNGVIVVSASR